MQQVTNQNKYNLEERTAKLAEQVIVLCKSIKLSAYNRRTIEQLIASSGSIGANYCEANESESKKDFIHKIGIAKKEIKESMHWLRLLATIHPEKNTEIKVIWKETKELLLIFSKIKSSATKQ